MYPFSPATPMKTCGSAAAGSGVTAGTAINIASVTVISVRVFIVTFFLYNADFTPKVDTRRKFPSYGKMRRA